MGAEQASKGLGRRSLPRSHVLTIQSFKSMLGGKIVQLAGFTSA